MALLQMKMNWHIYIKAIAVAIIHQNGIYLINWLVDTQNMHQGAELKIIVILTVS